MIEIPFKQETFAQEMKPMISGVNLSLDLENIASSLAKVARRIPGIISGDLYGRLVKAYHGDNASQIEKTAIDYLQRAMLHFSLSEHLIYIILEIGNKGVTTKKSDTETTAWKYQTDQLNDDLLSTGWFWINSLIEFLNENLDEFHEWADSKEKKEYDNLPITLTDFNKWVGVELSGGEYFMLVAGWLIKEVWMDCVRSRGVEEKSEAISRAVCYEVMGRACEILAYSNLPSPIRRDVDNEMGKNHRAAADNDIRERVAKKFLSKATTYWKAVDLEIKKRDISQKKKNADSSPIIGSKDIVESDKFYYS